MKPLLFFCAFAVLGAGIAWTPAQAQSAERQTAKEISFRTQIKPIFDRSCISCHGASRQRGKLRLDTVEGIKKGGESGALYEAGKPETSILVNSINGTKGWKKMPMAGEDLKPAEKKLIADWVKQGGKL